MTIQISVVIWTIICFILLMVILRNLLFKPVLDMMDKRRERIDAAHVRKTELDKLTAEHEQLIENKRAEFEADQQRAISSKVDTIRSDSKKAIENAREARLHEVDDFRDKTDVDRTEILYELSSHTTELAAAFADSVIKG